ncbi:MAG: PTS sugar transporter subunit IIB [Planifilum sp.]|jgi:PTS system cellobiose-specific IIB component
MKIVLVCAAGMSTSLVVQRMKKEAANRQLDVEVIAIPMEEFDQQVQDASVVLVGPQVRFKLSEFEKKAEEYGVPVAMINPRDYGLINGEKILDDALALIDQR